jgi:hypothetical protein
MPNSAKVCHFVPRPSFSNQQSAFSNQQSAIPSYPLVTVSSKFNTVLHTIVQAANVA